MPGMRPQSFNMHTALDGLAIRPVLDLGGGGVGGAGVLVPAG